ncbi:unnamed protein product [Dimorphilus gyrociliatus]|uniref:J domain-containing protein n=1 Tax=Dimorphilus gyrociliatus TaxID=2664684 RepID=A0A7I8VGY2_9ANNE|nr:unnamed protein product [Dimorphilus gyrociliatus]
MEGNKDESRKCLDYAEKYLREGKVDQAKKFVIKAQKLYPTKRGQELLDGLSNGGTNADSSRSAFSNGNSDSSSAENVRFRQTANASETSGADTSFTADQHSGVKKILKAKDYYEILNVKRDCAEEDIKKAYRKLALKFHPDKNKAPGAADAFKKIGNAFTTLSDSNKRRRYDVHGHETESSNHRRHYPDDFESDISPEEVFNMFFGGGFPGGNVYTYRRHTGRRNGAQPEVETNYTMLLQLAPILMLVVLSLLSSFLVSEPHYSLSKTGKYQHMRTTQNLRISYWVKRDFNTEYHGSMRQLEQSVESDHLENLRHQCFKERTLKENMLWRARHYSDQKMYERASQMATPSCNKLEKIYA